MDDSCDKPIAHVAEDGRCQPLDEHLKAVSDLAAGFAEELGCPGWARLAGLWHDMGKYSEEFQKYIRSSSGLDGQVVTSPGKVDHSTCGAVRAYEKFGLPGRMLAYVIAGHHAGLPDWQTEHSGMAGLAQRLAKRIPRARPPEEILSVGLPAEKPRPGSDPSMWIRMLFSCVVDADCLDSEAFGEPEKARLRGEYPSLGELLPLFDDYMQKKQAGVAKSAVNEARAKILRQCILKAAEPSAIFTLSVPTGGGKTLSSMAFALNHALRHVRRRIIYVIPYTSIIEQTADQFREIFGDAVIEHHSNIETPETEDETVVRSRLASENWDAPIVVTTTVQFFESLYAARPRRCRKLHNIANSVVILDEVQLLPPDLLNPILKALTELHKNYGVTLLLSTATQPALAPMKTVDFSFEGLPNMVEIIENPKALHDKLKRVKVHVPADTNKQLPWSELAGELSGYPTVLCVVNRRDDCRKLHQLLPDGAIHLSALMCGAHRSKVIAGIKERLKAKVPTRVISTQLVEAGVDLDFPVVYRALAGLDSIAQAAGRCNREGLLTEGNVVVFVPESKTPAGLLRQAAEIGRRLLTDRADDPLAPERFAEYFKELYWLHGDRLDEKGILKDLMPDQELRFSFRTAAGKFHIIDESLYAAVIVRYGEGSKLLGLLTKTGPERWLMRKLQRYVVNVPRYALGRLTTSGEVEEPFPGIYVQSTLGYYDDAVGLVCDRQQLSPDDLII
jgi:CRISPR-associated endonuclease/helicase Cas3